MAEDIIAGLKDKFTTFKDTSNGKKVLIIGAVCFLLGIMWKLVLITGALMVVGYLIYAKGKKDRITVIPKSLAYYLSIYLKKVNDYVFPTDYGHICERSVQNILKEATRKAGINKKIVTHDLRKNFAINLENKGVKVTQIQKMLGHSKLNTTQMYLDCVQDDMTEIALKT